MVGGYFAHHGLPLQEDRDAIRVRFPSGDVAEVIFDALGRIGSVSVRAGGPGA